MSATKTIGHCQACGRRHAVLAASGLMAQHGYFDLYVPASFWRDHLDRMPEGEHMLAQTLSWSGRRARIWATPEQLRALRDDAAFYADSESVDECPRYLRESARNTIKAIDRKVGAA
jgi:hypothetical protein